MYDEIIQNLAKQISSEDLEILKGHDFHLGVFSEPYLSCMLDGKKTVESRFSKNKILPYKGICKDDIVIVKKSSGDILAYFTIKDIKFFDLRKDKIEEIKVKYNKQLCVDNEFWINKQNSNYTTLIFIDKIVKLKPFHINKREMQTWIKL